MTCVLVGQETYLRRWVRYELLQSFVRGNGILATHIHNVGFASSEKKKPEPLSSAAVAALLGPQGYWTANPGASGGIFGSSASKGGGLTNASVTGNLLNTDFGKDGGLADEGINNLLSSLTGQPSSTSANPFGSSASKGGGLGGAAADLFGSSAGKGGALANAEVWSKLFAPSPSPGLGPLLNALMPPSISASEAVNALFPKSVPTETNWRAIAAALEPSKQPAPAEPLPGPNPLEYLGFTVDNHQSRLHLHEKLEDGKWRVSPDVGPMPLSEVAYDLQGFSAGTFAALFPTYLWKAHDGHASFPGWAERAAQEAGR